MTDSLITYWLSGSCADLSSPAPGFHKGKHVHVFFFFVICMCVSPCWLTVLFSVLTVDSTFSALD